MEKHDTSTSNPPKHKPPSLPKDNFHFFPLSDPPADPLPPLDLLTSSTWTYCGPLLQLTSATLPPTFYHWSAHTFSFPSNTLTTNKNPAPSALIPYLLPILSTINTFLRTQNIHNYWLTIRATLPTEAFNLPRWHTDDFFFSSPFSPSSNNTTSSNNNNNNNNDPNIPVGTDMLGWKLCATLQGPGTFFAVDGAHARRVLKRAREGVIRQEKAAQEHVCSAAGCAVCGRVGEAVRVEVARRLAGKGVKVAQAARGQVVFLRVGEREGAVHSEPVIGCGRVFVNVVPGTEGELRGLMARWGMEFPRSWCLGVPVAWDGEGDVVGCNT